MISFAIITYIWFVSVLTYIAFERSNEQNSIDNIAEVIEHIVFNK